jgi:hypothetical protein
MAVDLTTGPTHKRAMGKLLDMYRAPWTDSSIQPGTPIVAAAAGVVTASRFESDAGHLIRIDHGGGYFTFYIHLRSRGVTQDQTVQAGQQIGELGNSGEESGGSYHLHYEVFQDANGDGSGAVSELIYPVFNGVEYHLGEGGNPLQARATSRNCGPPSPDGEPTIAHAANADGRLEVFVRGTDNGLWHMWQVAPGGSFSPWNSLGGGLASAPAVARNADGRLEVFMRGTDNALWHMWQVAPGGSFTPWSSRGGGLTSAPAVARNADGRLEVFARGTDNGLWHTWQVTPGGSFTPWSSLGGGLR